MGCCDQTIASAPNCKLTVSNFTCILDTGHFKYSYNWYCHDGIIPCTWSDRASVWGQHTKGLVSSACTDYTANCGSSGVANQIMPTNISGVHDTWTGDIMISTLLCNQSGSYLGSCTDILTI